MKQPAFEIEYVNGKFIGAYLSQDGLMANLYQRAGKGRKVSRGFFTLSDYRPEDFIDIWPALNDDESRTLRFFAPVVIRQVRDYKSKLNLAERLEKL